MTFLFNILPLYKINKIVRSCKMVFRKPVFMLLTFNNESNTSGKVCATYNWVCMEKSPSGKKPIGEKSPSRKAHQEKNPSAEVMGWKKAHHFFWKFISFYTSTGISILIDIHDMPVKPSTFAKRKSLLILLITGYVMIGIYPSICRFVYVFVS